MTIEPPSNCWTSAEQAIADAVASSPAFQNVVEVDNEIDAAAFVFTEETTEPEDGETFSKGELVNRFAYAQVYPDDEGAYGKTRSPSGRFEPFGSTIIYVERLIRERDQSETEAAAKMHRLFKNRMGDLIDEVIVWLAENGGPFLRSIVVSDGPGTRHHKRREAQGFWQGVEFTVTWGLVSQ